VFIKNIVIGSSTSALLNCIFSDSYLLLCGQDRPQIYSKIKQRMEIELWHELYWILFFENKLLTNNVKKVKVSDTEIEVMHTNNDKSIWEYQQLYLDTYTDVELTDALINITPGPVEVRDYFAVKRGMVHNEEKITTKENFVNEVIFFLSRRIDGNKNKKDAVAISYVEIENLHDFDYSDTMVRFKLEKIMNENLGLDRKVKIRHVKREVVPQRDFSVKGENVKKLSGANKENLYERYKSEYTR